MCGHACEQTVTEQGWIYEGELFQWVWSGLPMEGLSQM